MTKIVVKDAGRCGAPVGETIDVSEDRAARWVGSGWAALVDATGDQGSPEKLPTKKTDLLALYAEEIGTDPADDLEKVTVASLTEAIEAHRAGVAE